MTNDNHLSAMANEAKQAKRDNRKADAITLHDSGLEVNEIAKTMGISRRTANRYLESHIALTPESIQEGVRVNLISEKKGNLMYRAPGTHHWVIRKVYDRDGRPLCRTWNARIIRTARHIYR